MRKLSLFSELTTRAYVAAALLALFSSPLLADAVDVTVLDNTPDRVVLQYTFGDVTMNEVDIDGVKHVQLSLGTESLMKQAGAPELPRVCRSVIIPDAGAVTVSVLEADYHELSGINVVPSKGILLRTVNPADVPYAFGDAYERAAFFPGALAAAREPYILRDFRGVVVEVNPLQYNPVTRTLRLYTSMVVQVVTSGGGINLLGAPAHSGRIGRSFHKIYQHQFVNYSPDGLRYDPLDEEGDLLIICHDAWLGNVQPLVNHKNATGINTTMVGVSTIGNNWSAIKSYIQNLYNTTDLAFVLLVGDAAQVDTPSASGGASDPTYSKLAGSDDYPEIMIGRFSAENAAQVDTQVLRTIEYETTPAPLEDWFWKGVGVASNQGAGIGDEGQADNVHVAEIRDWLMAFGYTEVDEIYDPNANAGMVTTALNDGRGIINYCGHGSTTSWGTTGFNNGDVNALVNDNMLPFIVTVACVNGNFDGHTCFAEAWLRATNGSEPTGAIGCYASSINQSWAPPMEAQDEFNLLLVGEVYISYGALCYAGSCSMMDDYDSAGVSMFNTWHIFGDPSLRVAVTCTSAGTISLDRGMYACDDTAAILVVDCDLNLDDEVIDTTTINVASDTNPVGVEVLLSETGVATGQFAGTVELADNVPPVNALLVSEGDTVTATYIDEDNGQGGYNIVLTATATIDCTPPVISNVEVIDIQPRSATIELATDEPARAIVHYGPNCGYLPHTAVGGGYSTTPTVTLTGLETNTTYYFMAEAEDLAGNLGVEGNCYSFDTPNIPDFFTELFGGGIDLEGLSLIFTPNGSISFYAGCVEEITSLPTDPTGGTSLPLSDDDYEAVTIGNAVSLYGVNYSTFYVGSNGYITFGGGDTDYTESLDDHFDMPRISGVFDDLNPSSGGTVSWKQLADHVAVTWQNVPEYYSTGANTFQIELFFDGTITLSYLTLSLSDGLAGLSEGNGLDPDFFMADLSEMGDCGLLGDLNCDGVLNAFDIDPFVLALTDPAGYAAAWPDCDRMLADINGDGIVNAFDIDAFVALIVP